jgi:hypothetical protein
MGRRTGPFGSCLIPVGSGAAGTKRQPANPYDRLKMAG